MTDLSPMLEWPPPYKIKKHRKARHVKLRTAKSHGLEITVPYRFNLRDIPTILEDNKAWITKQLLQQQAQMTEELPHTITLNVVNEDWTIQYMPCRAKLELIQRPQREIVLVGAVEDKALCKEKLVTWLKQQASIHLIALLQQLSASTTLSFATTKVRDQQTLWGSCTVKKDISLNYKLIFLPRHLAAHVLIHELCHTQHLNHSDRFWRLVASHDPAWQEHRRALRRANQFIPGWVA